MDTVIRNYVKDFRLEKDLTQEGLAQAVGVSRLTIVELEKGTHNPSLKLCFKLANFFHKRVDELFVEVLTPSQGEVSTKTNEIVAGETPREDCYLSLSYLGNVIFSGLGRTGKTSAAIHLIAQFINAMLPSNPHRFIVFDTHNEYRKLATLVNPELIQYGVLGEDSPFYLNINPLRIPKHTDAKYYIALVAEALTSSYDLTPPWISLFKEALYVEYEQAGVFRGIPKEHQEMAWERSQSVTLETFYQRLQSAREKMDTPESDTEDILDCILLKIQKNESGTDAKAIMDNLLNKLRIYVQKHTVRDPFWRNKKGLAITDIFDSPHSLLILDGHGLETSEQRFLYSLLFSGLSLFLETTKPSYKTIWVADDAKEYFPIAHSKNREHLDEFKEFHIRLKSINHINLNFWAITQIVEYLPKVLLENTHTYFLGRTLIDSDIKIARAFFDEKFVPPYDLEFNSIYHCPMGVFACNSVRISGSTQYKTGFINFPVPSLKPPSDEELLRILK